MAHFTATNSVDQTGPFNAFTGTGPGTLIVDAGAFLIAEQSFYAGASLSGSWTATINGALEGLGPTGRGLLVTGSASDASHIALGSGADVFGTSYGILSMRLPPSKIRESFRVPIWAPQVSCERTAMSPSPTRG
jgi:hypothetical protein